MATLRGAQKLAVSVQEGMEMIGVGRNTFLRLLHSGEIRFVRTGRRIVIPVSALEEWLEGNSGREAKE